MASAIGVWLYEASTSRAQALLPSDRAVHSVAFSLDGTLAAGLDNGRVELWEVETGERTGTLRHAGWDGSQSWFSPDGDEAGFRVIGAGHQGVGCGDPARDRHLGGGAGQRFLLGHPWPFRRTDAAGLGVSGRHGPAVGGGDPDGGGHAGRAHGPGRFGGVLAGWGLAGFGRVV